MNIDFSRAVSLSTSLIPNDIANALRNFTILEPGFVAVLASATGNNVNRIMNIRVNNVTQFFAGGTHAGHAIFPVVPGDEITVDIGGTGAAAWNNVIAQAAQTLIPGTQSVTAAFYPGNMIVTSSNITEFKREDSKLWCLIDGEWLEVTPEGVLTFLDILRNNTQTLISFDRADSAHSPYYWVVNSDPTRIMTFRDGTFGIRQQAIHSILNGEIMNVAFRIPPISEFHLIDFGGRLTLLDDFVNPNRYGDQISANFGTVRYTRASNMLNYEVRIFDFFKPIVHADIWVRFATEASQERHISPIW